MAFTSASPSDEPAPVTPSSVITVRRMRSIAGSSRGSIGRTRQDGTAPRGAAASSGAVAVSECFDVHHQAIFESHASHQLVRAEIVDPDFDRHVDESVSDVEGTATDPEDGSAKDGALIDLRGLAAL